MHRVKLSSSSKQRGKSIKAAAAAGTKTGHTESRPDFLISL
jgi:hypothetical protein